MKNSLQKIVLGASLMLPLSSCVPTQNYTQENTVITIIETKDYDLSGHNMRQQDLDNILDATVMLMTNKGAQGTGVVLHDDDENKDYVLTCAHLFLNEKQEQVANAVLVVKDEELVNIGSAGIVSPGLDLALIELVTEYETPYKGKISDGADIGDYIIGVSYPGIITPMVNTGNIGGSKSVLTNITYHVNPGSSGHSVYVLKNGVPEISGVALSYFRDIQGASSMVNEKGLRNFLKGTPVENEYLKVDKK